MRTPMPKKNETVSQMLQIPQLATVRCCECRGPVIVEAGRGIGRLLEFGGVVMCRKCAYERFAKR